VGRKGARRGGRRWYCCSRGVSMSKVLDKSSMRELARLRASSLNPDPQRQSSSGWSAVSQWGRRDWMRVVSSQWPERWEMMAQVAPA